MHNLKYYDEKIFFFIVDVYIPENENFFVCNVNKVEKLNKTFWATGL